jgi:hypothetical protein
VPSEAICMKEGSEGTNLKFYDAIDYVVDSFCVCIGSDSFS